MLLFKRILFTFFQVEVVEHLIRQNIGLDILQYNTIHVCVFEFDSEKVCENHRSENEERISSLSSVGHATAYFIHGKK